ncbi:MAG: hypothetical protein IKY74_01525 [Alistipes sp.]|nr:hypothetical protein [Alistipes sp.]
MLRLVAIVTLILFVGCSGAADNNIIMEGVETPTITIGDLRQDVVGSAGVTLPEGCIVRGRVTSSDRDDNFYNQLVVEDGSGALMLCVALSHIDSYYPEGLDVSLRLDDLEANYYRGVLQVGTDALGYTGVGDIESRQVIERTIRRGESVELLAPQRVAIRELELRQCGRLVRIEDVAVVASTALAEGQTLADATWQGYALFKNEVGDSIAVRTSKYATFATERIPLERVSLTGILEWGSYGDGPECYHLIMRYNEDCAPMP